MNDLGYILTGYGVTAGALLAYRAHLGLRAQRARRLITALRGRPHPVARGRR